MNMKEFNSQICTTRIMAIVIGIYIARFLPLWLEGIIAVCAFVVLVISQMEE